MPSIAKMVLGNGPLGPSLTPLIRRYPGVQKYWSRWTNLYKHVAGYRQNGYMIDDLIMEENQVVQKAISRLPETAGFDRAFRLRQGLVASMHHQNLPKSKWTKPEEDKAYLTPYIRQVLAEDAERAEWDHMAVERLKARKAGKKSPFDIV